MRNMLLVVGLACAMVCCAAIGIDSSGQDRAPIGAGQFYPGSPATLKAAVDSLLRDAGPPIHPGPVAIVVPHAGYVYSGLIAAHGYAEASLEEDRTVVIVGTNHTDAAFRRVAILPGKSFRTPLGNAPIDEEFATALRKEDPDCVLDAAPHRSEHSVEVQVPFIQRVLPKARIVPLVVGRPDRDMCVRLGRALATLAKSRLVLLVASSDLSHYPSADDANRVDRSTLEAIASMDVDRFYRAEFGENVRVPQLDTRACGAGPIIAVMTAARLMGATNASVLAYANSADSVVGDKSRVVGYGAVSFYYGLPSLPGELPVSRKEVAVDVQALERVKAEDSPLEPSDRRTLLRLARFTIERTLTTTLPPIFVEFGWNPRLLQRRGVFVTLKKRGELRGCIGHIPNDSELARMVNQMAYAAAFQDPRFDKLALPELRDVEIEISVLTPPKRVSGPSDIVVGRDGVFLTADGTGAVFLPQVATEQGWNRDQMLSELCVKAGLPANRWRRPGVTYSTFQADIFSEHEFGSGKSGGSGGPGGGTRHQP